MTNEAPSWHESAALCRLDLCSRHLRSPEAPTRLHMEVQTNSTTPAHPEDPMNIYCEVENQRYLDTTADFECSHYCLPCTATSNILIATEALDGLEKLHLPTYIKPSTLDRERPYAANLLRPSCILDGQTPATPFVNSNALYALRKGSVTPNPRSSHLHPFVPRTRQPMVHPTLQTSLQLLQLKPKCSCIELTVYLRMGVELGFSQKRCTPLAICSCELSAR